MTKKRSDLSTRFMQSLVDQDADASVAILQGASDEGVKKLLEAMVQVTRLVAGYAMKRGIPIDNAGAVVVVEMNDEAGAN